MVDSNSVYDLCEKLIKINSKLNLHIVTTESKYKTDISLRAFDSTFLKTLNIHKIKSYYSGKGIFRIINDVFTSFRLVFYAKSLNIQTIISLSNPPLINTICGLLLRKRNYIYWSFDLFPEALFANNLLNERSLIGRILLKLTYYYPPYAIIGLGPKQFEYLQSKYGSKEIIKIIMPCGIHQFAKSDIVPKWYCKNKVTLGYIGNLGKAHSKDFLINVISVIDDFKSLKLLISIYGEYSDEVLLFLKENGKPNNVEIIEPVSQNQLGFIDIHLVSLLDNWTNISVPSKAVSAVCSNSTLWYNGSPFSDTFNFFGNCSYFSDSDLVSVKEVLFSITEVDVNEKKINAEQIAQEMRDAEQNSIIQIINLLE